MNAPLLNDKDMPAWLRAPIPLQPNNFTPLTRTPWGGTVIASHYKRDYAPVGAVIGEAWEFSCDPAFPSRLQGHNLTLLDAVQKWPEAILSPALAQSGATCEILVKLLDAAEPLSLQVHPRDGDQNLQVGECGKPESWLVLKAAPGAGIYLGFSRQVSRTELREALIRGDTAKDLLHFVSVKPGDYFEIQPGVPHAIGGGVTLLEPQRILTGQAGKTYRMWDWGRLYDKDGRLDMEHGAARPLHVDESLPLVDPEQQVGEAFVGTLRREPTVVNLAGGISIREFPANPYYKTALAVVPAGAELNVRLDHGYCAMLTLEGQVTANQVPLGQGQTALVPYVASPLNIVSTARSEIALVAPSQAALHFTSRSAR